MLFLYIAVGGAVGSLARYLMVSGVSLWLGKEFPYGTLLVNILGGFLMGLFIGFIATMLPKGRDLHALIAIGLLGGFTTFSSFSLDLYMLMEKQLWVDAALYAAGSVLLSVMALFSGLALFRYVTA